MTTYDKFSPLKRDNLIQPISMLLSQKEKRFSEHTSIFFKLTLNFHHFHKKKKNDRDRLYISDITDSETGG